MVSGHSGLTALFERMRQGDDAARAEIADRLYSDLHQMAARYMSHEQPSHTLQPTALVHEAYLRMVDGPDAFNGRTHFMAMAAVQMRRVLVDHARRKHAGKRGAGAVRVLVDDLAGPGGVDLDLLNLERLLTDLAAVDAGAARVVELRFFGGHTDGEVCELLGISLARARRDWRFARAWLRTRLEPGGAS